MMLPFLRMIHNYLNKGILRNSTLSLIFFIPVLHVKNTVGLYGLWSVLHEVNMLKRSYISD